MFDYFSIIGNLIPTIMEYVTKIPGFIVTHSHKNETIVTILKILGLNPTQIPDDLDTVYVYTLVHYGVFLYYSGVSQPQPMLRLLRDKRIKDYFWAAYTNNIPFTFANNVQDFLEHRNKLQQAIINSKIELL